MSKKIEFLKNFVYDNRAKIAAGVTAAAFIAVMMKSAKSLNEFLKEHDLYDEYYSIED